jgi:hypothetical protein
LEKLRQRGWGNIPALFGVNPYVGTSGAVAAATAPFQYDLNRVCILFDLFSDVGKVSIVASGKA